MRGARTGVAGMLVAAVLFSAPAAAKGPLLSKDDIRMLSLAVRLQERLGDSVWPGYARQRTAVLYMTRDGQVLLGEKDPPAGYEPYGFEAPWWSPVTWYSRRRMKEDGSLFTKEEFDSSYIASAYSSEQTGRRFPRGVFLLDSIDRFHSKGMDWSVEDWLSIFWHEMFHAYQDGQYDPRLISDGAQDYSLVEPLVKDPGYRARVVSEQGLLGAALLENDPGEKRRSICEGFLPRRLERRKWVEVSKGSATVAAESFYEVSEGTARYAEEMLTVAASRAAPALLRSFDSGLLGRKGYSGFRATKHRDAASYYGSLADLPKDGRYYYATGFGLALLLDQVEPGWKKSVFRTPGFLQGMLVGYCRDGTGARRSSSSRPPRRK